VEHQLTARDLLRLAGGEAYWRGSYSAIEGLAGKLKVSGDTLSGRVLWSKDFDTRLQLVSPFTNKCSCPKGGNCRHVVTLGLTFLHQERQNSGSPSCPEEEHCYYLVTLLDHTDLRGLAMELLAAVPEATPVATKYLDRPGHFREWDAYVLDWQAEEED
jgi:uncharacterized Zn finger protein